MFSVSTQILSILDIIF